MSENSKQPFTNGVYDIIRFTKKISKHTSTYPEGYIKEVCVVPGDSNENKPLVGAEEEEVAKMGCPSLGEHTQLEVVIEESYEFKVGVFPHKLNIRFTFRCKKLDKNNHSSVRLGETLRNQQFDCQHGSCTNCRLKSKIQI